MPVEEATTHVAARPRVRTFARACAAAIMLVTVLGSVPAFASTYDPLDIISYEVWRGSSSMSVKDIQAFLESKSGPLKTLIAKEHDIEGVTTPVKKPASQLIYEAARAWNLNPKVIIATLQKEQSLITISNSNNSARYRKAMGCGVYGDANNDGITDNRYPGFGNQIWHGARKLSTYELPGTGGGQIPGGWVPGTVKKVTAYKTVVATKTVDGVVVTYDKRVSYTKSIYPKNACTWALYTYTPYYPQKSFWTIYTQYFGDTKTPPRMRPVYRFRSRYNGTYYYTASEAKRYTLIRTASRKWLYQGASFSVDTSAAANTVALLQMYNTRTQKYLYTTSTAKRDSLLQVRPLQWRYDRVVCYVATETSGTAPVYKLEKKTTHGIVLTSSSSLRTSLTTGRYAPFYDRGIAFRLDSLETTSTPVGPTP